MPVYNVEHKQPFKSVIQKTCSENFFKIHGKTTMTKKYISDGNWDYFLLLLVRDPSTTLHVA